MLSAVNSAINPSLLNKLTNKIINVFAAEGINGGEPFDLVFVEEDHVYSSETNKEVHGRTSIENLGVKVQITVHLNSSTLPGTDPIFQKVTVLHELLHARIQYSSTSTNNISSSSHSIILDKLFNDFRDAIKEITGLSDNDNSSRKLITALALFGLGELKGTPLFTARMSDYEITDQNFRDIEDLYEKVVYDNSNNIISIGGSNCQP
ncbi:hypothetical protein [Flectobacillus longus]|uniref:hypothetical protein n=1 Tax=Flectobacillus longus TaxID=2984207 RepID=UPI0024B6897A|nr:hypothetical protein [Flectobacillus longus]MDI9877798.1 hypothetical protein [Flectobacillus longus]